MGNLADKRLSGHDALVLDEAELLLTLGAERFALFHDVPATITAYRAADAALSQIDDAAFSTVRETIAAEITGLNDLHASDPASINSRLAALRAEISRLPAAGPRRQRLQPTLRHRVCGACWAHWFRCTTTMMCKYNSTSTTPEWPVI